ncbi:hypothetical protein HDV62DRAFT_295790 [Trichoderma sp. SZMC 28011]
MCSTVAIINAQRTSPDSRRGPLGSCWTYIHMYECPMRPYNFKYKKRVHQLPIISLYRVLCRPVPVPTRRRNKPHLVYPSILVFCPGFDSTAPTWNHCNRYRVQEQARVLSKLRSCWCSDPTISQPHICN